MNEDLEKYVECPSYQELAMKRRLLAMRGNPYKNEDYETVLERVIREYAEMKDKPGE